MGRITRKPSQKQTRFDIKVDSDIAATLVSLVPVGDEAELSKIVGYRDPRGNLRRARVVWSNGWTADLFFTLPRDGKVSLSSYRVNWHGECRPGAKAS